MKKEQIKVTLPVSGMNGQPRVQVIESMNGSGTSGKSKRRRRNRQRRRLEREEVNLLSGAINNKMRLKGENVTREGLRPNPADPRSHVSALNQLGTTIGGRMAALKILHPNGEGDEYVTRFPDGCANTTIVMERRDEFKVEAPATAVQAAENWNCILIENPYLFASEIAIRWGSTENPTVAELNSAAEEALSYPGRTTRQWPAFETVTIGGFMFDVSVLAATALTPNYTGTTDGPATDIKSIRRTYMGSTIDLDASDLYNQGRVVAGQWKPDVTLGIANYPGVDPNPAGAANVYLMQTPAVIINNIVQSDELVYQAEAKCGLYIPTRPAEMDIPMTASQEYRTVFPRVPSESPVAPLPQIDLERYDLWLRGWLIGVSYWSDMDYRASLRIKRKEGVEFISAPAGPFAPFADEALPADLRAQQMLQEFSRREPHGYPADFNELGKLLQSIVGGIADAVGNLGIPVLSDIGNTVGTLARGKVGSGLASILDQIA